MLHQQLPEIESGPLEGFEPWLAPVLAAAAGVTASVMLLLFGQMFVGILALAGGLGTAAVLARRENFNAHGFDVLESDHKVIHEQIDRTVKAANAFLRTPLNDEALRGAGERYAAAGDALLRLLTQHLGDEEDLIIPLILDRTEAALGVG